MSETLLNISKSKTKPCLFIIPALLSAFLLIAAFPPFEQGYIAWFALIPLITLCLQVKPVQAFKAGIFFGLVFHLYVNFYLTNVLFTYLSTPLAVLAMILLILYTSLFHGLFAIATSLVNQLKRPLFTALAIPAIWLLSEYIRSFSFLGYNVGYLGYTQWQYPGLLNLAATYGYWGLPFMIVFFQATVVLICIKALRQNKLVIIAALFIFLFAAGLSIPGMSTIKEKNETIWVTLIQGNTHPEQIMGNREETKRLYLDLTRQAVTFPTDLVVWPETVIDLDFNRRLGHPTELVETADDLDVAILYGARLRNSGMLFNSIALYEPGIEENLIYEKIRLVPFVEYFPAKDLLNKVIKLDLLLGSYTAGEEIIIFEVKNKPLAGVICFESYFGDHTRLFAAKGAQHLFVLTNDAWFGRSNGLDQHAQAAAIRAAEMGIGVTQVANSGITISFDYNGREILRSSKEKRETINTQLSLAHRYTPYKSLGDYFPAFWALFLLLGILLIIRRKAT